MRQLLGQVSAFEAKLKKDPYNEHKPREDTQFIVTLEGLFAIIGY